MNKVRMFLFLLLSFSVLSYEQDLKFVTHELKPFTWVNETNQEMHGIVYEMCRETIVRMGYKNPKIEVWPFIRVLEVLQKENDYVAFHVARNAERENTMKWVGPIIFNGVYFYKNKNTDFKAETIEDFKELDNIGVGKANASQEILKNQGFKNIYEVNNEMQALQMLKLNRVDAVPVGEFVVNELAKQSMVDMKSLEKTKVKLTESVLYIGFSKNISDAEIKKWQAVFETVKKEKYNELYKKYISK